MNTTMIKKSMTLEEDGPDLAVRLEEMEEALHALDANTKRAYFLAKESVQHLVERETPLVAFLRVEQYTPTAAAQRLARYWTYRRHLFGERWLFPMSQTGGALGPREIELVQSGMGSFRVLFSQNNKNNEEEEDEETPRVFLHDGSKAMSALHQDDGNDIMDDEVAHRCMMYIGTAWTDKVIQTQGSIQVYLVSPEDRRTLFVKKGVWNLLRNVLPIKVPKMIVVQAHVPYKEHLMDFLSYQACRVHGMSSGLPITHVAGHSVADIARQLQGHGVPLQAIPTSFGGTLLYDQALHNWTRTRLSIEDVLSGTTLPRKHVPLKPPRRRRQRSNKFIAAQQDEDDNNVQPLTLQEKRQRQAMYSRRTYHRQQIVAVTLKEQVKLMERKNQEARQEYKRLQNLLGQAQAMVQGVEAARQASSWFVVGGTATTTTATSTTTTMVVPHPLPQFQPHGSSLQSHKQQPLVVWPAWQQVQLPLYAPGPLSVMEEEKNGLDGTRKEYLV